jgi:hypothetical protein
MAQVVNISIDQGSDFSWSFDLSKLAPSANVANATPFASLMTEYDQPNTAVSFVCSLVGSNLTISLPHGTTANLVASANTYEPVGMSPTTWVYDAILVSPSNTVTRVVQGRAHIYPMVTPP